MTLILVLEARPRRTTPRDSFLITALTLSRSRSPPKMAPAVWNGGVDCVRALYKEPSKRTAAVFQKAQVLCARPRCCAHRKPKPPTCCAVLSVISRSTRSSAHTTCSLVHSSYTASSNDLQGRRAGGQAGRRTGSGVKQRGLVVSSVCETAERRATVSTGVHALSHLKNSTLSCRNWSRMASANSPADREQ